MTDACAVDDILKLGQYLKYLHNIIIARCLQIWLFLSVTFANVNDTKKNGQAPKSQPNHKMTKMLFLEIDHFSLYHVNESLP
jgi:hypothetical protein